MKTSLRLLCVLLILALSAGLFVSCAQNKTEYRDFNYFAMDTYIRLRLARTDKDGKFLSDAVLQEAADGCADILADIEGTISAYAETSDVYALNADVNKMLSADEMLLSLLSTADRIHQLTDGVFDYTLGTLTELWNVSGGGPVPAKEDIAEALTHTGKSKFAVSGSSITKLDAKAKLDFGGIGKGVAAQKVLEYLSTTDVAYGLISLGGNIGVYGEKPEYGEYKIGISDPGESSAALGYLYLTSGFVSVSGDYERYFEEDGVLYHHIIDPRTGYPSNSDLQSVAVHTPNGASADALSTALFILGLEKSLELYNEGRLDFEAVFVTDSGEVIVTPGLTDRFELTNNNYTLPQND